MRYIVTGGAGFIGSNLAERLTRDDHEVVIIDDLSSGRHENIENLISHPRVTFIKGSVTDLALLTDASAGAAGIFHLAAIASVPRSVEKPLETNEVNVAGTLNVLWAAKECGVPAVVAASTSAIYGDDPASPKHETMAPTPLSPPMRSQNSRASTMERSSLTSTAFGRPSSATSTSLVPGRTRTPSMQR